MKKLILACLCIGALTSCNVKDSSEYKQLEAQNDSLRQVNAASKSQIGDLNSSISDVQSNFAKIAEAEKYLTVQSNTKGEIAPDTKTQINNNFQMINDILKKNKASLAALSARLGKSKGDVTGLKKMVANLNAELTQKTDEVLRLQQTLAARDKQIAELTNNVKDLNSSVEQLSTTTTQQATQLKNQDEAMNTAYYRFGTSSELNELEVKGKISSDKVLALKSSFIQIDIRNTQSIPLYTKKAKVLSAHPASSYTLTKDASGQITIEISDYKKFWSMTKYLVVRVN